MRIGRWLFLAISIPVLALWLLNPDRVALVTALFLMLGAGMNALAILANGGMMPVKGRFKMDERHREASPSTKFAVLCDRYNVRLGRRILVFSLGDCLITLAGSSAIYRLILYS